MLRCQVIGLAFDGERSKIHPLVEAQMKSQTHTSWLIGCGFVCFPPLNVDSEC